MLVGMLSLLLGFAALLALLKLVGVIGWSWLTIAKVVAYPASFLGTLVLLALVAIALFRLGRYLADRKERRQS